MTSALTTEHLAELRTGHTAGDDLRLPETMSPRRMAWKRYWHHRGAAISTILLGIVMLMVLATPLTARYGINEQVITIDGLRVEYADGFGLARTSNPTPVVVMRFEAESDAARARIQQEFWRVILAA